MPISNNYYYPSELAENQYGTTPTNMLNVSRMLQNKPFWRQLFGPALMKKKVLILNDPAITKWGYKERAVDYEVIKALQNQGFRIYCYRKEQFFEHNNQLLSPALHFDSKPVNDKRIIENAVKQLQLSHDEILVLNHEELTKLIQGIDEDLLKLNSFEIVNLKESNINIATLNELLKRTGSKIKSLNLCHCLNLNGGSLSEAFSLEQLEKLLISENSNKINNLKSSSIKHLIKSAPNLKTLSLNHYDHLDDLINNSNFTLLEELDLSESTVNYQTLSQLLANAPKLKILDLEYYININDEPATALNLPSLEKLNLNNSPISSHSLSKLLTNTPKLKILGLGSCNNLDDEPSNALNLPSLEVLDLNRSTLSSQTLCQLLTNTPKLKILTLFDCRNLNNEFISALNLPSLEELDLRHSTISSQSLNKLLANSSKLRILRLNRNLYNEFISEFNRPSLEELDVLGSIISCQSLNKLLANAPKLRILRTRNDLNDEFISESSLSSLEELDLTGSVISSQSLNKLLINAPKLKILKLGTCKNLKDELTTTFNLPFLEEIDLTHAAISSQCLSTLITSAPTIKSINLGGCIILGDKLPEHLNFSSLHILDFSYCTISHELIKKIQAQAPHLKIIPPIVPAGSDLRKLLSLGDAPKAHFPSVNISLNNSFNTSTRRVAKSEGKETLDADTRYDPNKKYVLERLFYASDAANHPEPRNYRQTIFNQFETNKKVCTAKNAFLLGNTSNDWEIKACEVTQSSEDLRAKLQTLPDASQCFYSIQRLSLSEYWQSLASLSAEEVMMEYRLSPAVDVEIGYSQRDNLYCIRRKPGIKSGNEPVTIEFIVKVPLENQNPLPADIRNKIKECLNFGMKPLKTKPNACGADYLEALQTQKVGSCRHRAVVFKEWMDKRIPYLPSRINNNNCHSAVEVYENNHWVSCDLGGYPAQVVIHEQSKAVPVAQSTTLPAEKSEITSDQNPIAPMFEKRYFTQAATEKNKASSAAEYMQQTLSSPCHKKLIQLANEQSLNGFRHHLQQYCHSSSRPCFYIHSPEELICAAPYIKRTGTSGMLKKGPGGPLHDFLQQHSKDGSKPVLIVNYERFSAQDMVRFNTLLDKERLADGSPVPPAAQVIGLMNTSKPDAYNGADFLSRFDAILSNTLSAAQLVIPPLTVPFEPSKDSQSINLYGGNDWEERLFGHWVLKGHQLHFIEGELVVALKNNTTAIELKNAPWADSSFQVFWQKALLEGSFQVYGVNYPLPKGLKLSATEGYSFEKTRQQLKINESEVIPPDALVLNLALLGRFFNQYRCQEHEASIHYEAGLLEKNHKKTINLYLSDSLDLPSWALFLDKCTQHEVQVHLTLAPGITLPQELGIPYSVHTAAEAKPWPLVDFPATAYIYSTDIDVTLKQLPEDALVLDVSEVTSPELLLKLDGRFDEQHLKFAFNEQEGALLKALKDNKTVILKGKIPEELRHVLSEFLLKRQQQLKPKGCVLLVSDKPHLFPMLPSWSHNVTLEEKKKCLSHQFSEEHYSKHSLARLQAMARHLALHPKDSEDKAWQGMETLPPALTAEPIELKNADQAVAAFNQQRMSAVENALHLAPFVFLAGITGAGKTTFIHEHWKKKHAKVYFGEDSKLAWAKDHSPGIKTLFIDEANISSRQWSEFEGLFHTPPRLLINNEVVELTKEHKVIFAGNPVTYGGGRQMPSLFARHGNSVLFNPLPPACLYQEVLKPIFAGTQLDSEELARPILEVAQYCNRLDEKKTCITPREQGMMALLTVSYCHKNPDADAEEVAHYYAYTIAQRFVPEDKKKEFDAQFHHVEGLPRPSIDLPGDLLLNEHNYGAYAALHDLLKLRELRQAGTIQADGGLGGLVIEGAPGLGKTELVVSLLRAYGLQKGALNRKHPDEAVFYVLPVSTSYEEKIAVLLKAFHEGAPVVMDEMNSSPMLEQLLNDLLMGKDPAGNKAKKSGFILLGTQNPPTMAGRIRPSTAFDHRMQQEVITDYSQEKMVDILVSKGLPEAVSQEMTLEYLNLRQHALLEASPPLCFRDLIRQAEFELKAIAHRAKPLQAFLTLLDGLRNKQKDYLERHPAAYVQAQELIGLLENKAKAFYKNHNPKSEEVIGFKQDCVEIIEQNSSILKQHRAFFGNILAAIHQFFKALLAFVMNEPTKHGFFDGRSKGAIVADELADDIKRLSIGLN